MRAPSELYAARIGYTRSRVEQANSLCGDIRQENPIPAATDLWVWEDLLGLYNTLFERMLELDTQIQSDILAERLPFSDEREGQIDALFASWLSVRDSMVRNIGRLEAEYGPLNGAETYLRHAEECRGILTPDGEFFAGPKLLALEGMALRDAQAGRLEPLI